MGCKIAITALGLMMVSTATLAQVDPNPLLGTWQSEENRGRERLTITLGPDVMDSPDSSLFGRNNEGLEVSRVLYERYDRYILVFPQPLNGLAIKFVSIDANTIALHVDQQGGHDLIFHKILIGDLRSKSELDSLVRASSSLAMQVIGYTGLPLLQKRFAYIAAAENLTVRRAKS